MTKTETKARAGEDLSAGSGAEVKTALAGFVSDFKGFQAEMKTKLQQQEERLTMLDRKSLTRRVPRWPPPPRPRRRIRRRSRPMCASGDDDALRGLELEGKAMSTAVAGDGGYLVDPQTAETIKSVLKSTASIRADRQRRECRGDVL